MVVKAGRLPAPGETVTGGKFLMNPGGKGANQAVAVARLGGNVAFVAKIGDDLFGQQSLAHYQTEKIDTKFVFTDEIEPSGIALISVDAQGENCIIVAPGANGALTCNDVDKAREEIVSASYLLMQLETPLETVTYAASLAYAAGVKVVLNPAPAPTSPLPDELLKYLHIIIPNETEAALLSGIPVTDKAPAHRASEIIRNKGVDIVIITLGSDGVLVNDGGSLYEIPAVPVVAVDTTAAGDTFCGGLCVGLSEGMSLAEAVRFACKAASITVTRMGAQTSIPQRSIVNF
jgi:ribokinase